MGSGLCSTPPSSVSAEIPQGPAGPTEACGQGDGVWVGRWEETQCRPWPELRAARHLGPGSASGLPCTVHQESQAGPAGPVSPARILGGGRVYRVPGKQRPLQLRPLTRSLHFFSKQKFSL